MAEPTMEKIVSLCKRRGFIYPGSEIYGGLSGTWDYGPLGVELKNNIKNIWWKLFVQERDDMYGVDAAILMNPKVWEASGHVDGFSDPLGNARFNLLFETNVGAAEDAVKSYLRPETAGGIFVNFKNVVDSFHPRLPFGIAQVGKAFRNEIAPRDFLFRVRELEQMEIEYFIRPDEWEKHFEEWRQAIYRYVEAVGIDRKKVHELEVPLEERAHYSKRTIDFEFDWPFGRKELYGLAYRTDFDLGAHSTQSSVDLSYLDEERKERLIPHVVEPSFGVDRTILALLLSAYSEDEMGDEPRIFLRFNKVVAPIKIAVFPLLKNKPQLVEKARDVYALVKKAVPQTMWDDNGNIGKRYRRQDEIGTPQCITIDFQTLEDDTVTLRDRDTGQQERVAIQALTARIGGTP
ncbi:glycine--tRNA ligase [Candidatus Kaiserbacteria bacterium]|nr:glycine--tRNA ligase [Candidatus Kaiserbacteria bacterium]